MRIVAIIANMILLGLSIIFVSDKFYMDVSSFLFSSVFILTPILSIVALVMSRGSAKSFIGLWFARKAEEEKMKIEKLQSQKKSEQ